MFLFLFKVVLILVSAACTVLSFVYMFSPKTFSNIGSALGLEFTERVTAIEGKDNVQRNFLFKIRYFLGPLLAILSALNTINAFFI